MRDIDLIIIHCSATAPSFDIGVKEIRKWHMDKGWSDVGYHYVIRRNGKLETGRDVETIGAHAKGHNANSIGVCLVGGTNEHGKPDANFSFKQYETLKHLHTRLKTQYPDAQVLGHRDLAGVAKACPCFNAQELLSDIV